MKPETSAQFEMSFLKFNELLNDNIEHYKLGYDYDERSNRKSHGAAIKSIEMGLERTWYMHKWTQQSE